MNGKNFSFPIDDLSYGETPSEGGAANRQSEWESKEFASNVGIPMGAHEMQLETPTPSTSNTVARLGGQKKRRKREESGKCDECTKDFTRKSDAKRHKKEVHEKEEYVCELCHIRCCRKDALQRHMEGKHA